MFLTLLLVFLSIAYILRKLLLTQLQLKWKIEAIGLPFYRGNIFFGNVLQFLNWREKAPGLPSSFYALQSVAGCAHLFKEKGLFTFSLGLARYIVFNKAETAQVLLSHQDEVQKSPDYEFTESVLGNGLVTCGVEKWRKQRKYLTPAFHFRLMEKAQQIMCEQSAILVDNFKKGVGEDGIAIDTMLKNCTLDIIAESAFGVKFNSQRTNSSTFVEAANSIEACLFERMISPWLWPDILFSVSKTGRKVKKDVQYIRSVLYEIIKKTKHQILEDHKGLTTEEIVPASKNSNFIQLLLAYNLTNEDEHLSDDDILTEAITFLGAGYETTGVTLCWTMYMLGLHPEVLFKVHEEMDGIFKDECERSVTSSDLTEMTYLERVIKETLRLYSTVPIIGRQLQSDLLVENVLLPKGSTCLIQIGALHLDPSVYPNPEIFDPDRFLDSSRNPYAFVPFSAGPRNCIGQKYAMMELKIVLAYLLRTFKVTSLDPRDKILPNPGITMHPSSLIRLKVELRTT